MTAVGGLVHLQEDEANDAEHAGQADGGGGDVGGGAAGGVTAEQLIEATQARLAVGAQPRADGAGEQQEDERSQGQERGRDVEQPGLCQAHDYPFSSSAVSTSTVMWLL
jgi:hypothetical protein